MWRAQRAGGGDDPFLEAHGDGWEDDENAPRGVTALVTAVESTGRIVEGCLDEWTPDMLSETFERLNDGKPQVHSRTSVLQRVFSHDAYHCGALSQTVGIAGFRQVDLWGPGGKGA